MAAQLDYGYGMSKGVPGGKYDLSMDVVVTRTNEEADGVLRFGMAAMAGSSPGTTVKVPVSGALEVVADDTASPTAAQIKVSGVTPVSGGYVPAVSDHVEKKKLHGDTVDIGSNFGTEKDDGIAVIILK